MNLGPYSYSQIRHIYNDKSSFVDLTIECLPMFDCSEEMSDVLIVVNGSRSFPAHRVVLAAASPRLKEMMMAAAPTTIKGSGANTAHERVCGAQKHQVGSRMYRTS